jgi:2,5-diketo-D-gluconate reductase A
MAPDRIKFSDGNAMPQLGYGTWQIPDEDCGILVGEALRLGYRVIDTAQGYGNEGGVGRGLAESGVPRADYFVISKLRNGAHQRDLALQSFDETMRLLGLIRLDLFLIHWPVPEQDLYVEAWNTLIELQRHGRVRSIGVSNFTPRQIERLIAETGVAPVVNQIEIHPRLQQRDERGFYRRNNIQLQSWSPLGPGLGGAAWWQQHGMGGGTGVLDDPTIVSIAERHGKTPAQVVIRWHLDEGLMLFPKSIHPERLAENFEVFDFKLDAEDRYRIEAMDSGQRIGATPENWNRIF